MAGGKSTPKKDKKVKVSDGQAVKPGQILVRGIGAYKSGKNAKGLDTIYAVCEGSVYFSKKKTPHGRVRTFVNVLPAESAAGVK